MSHPWSKLQREIEKLFVPELKVRVHCRAYRMASQRGSTDLPRYWVTLNRSVIWDYPRDFKSTLSGYPYANEVSAISQLIRQYIDTPSKALLTTEFNDPWQLT